MQVKLILFALIFLSCSNTFVFAQTTSEIERITRKVGCLVTYDESDEIESTALVRYVLVGNEREARSFLNFKTWITRFLDRGKERNASKVKQCRKRGQTGGGSGGGGNPGGGGGENPGEGGEGGGGGSTTQDACSIVGDSSSSSQSARIINGIVCDIGDSPIVQLVISVDGTPTAACTGTVVSKRAVIFAAHCLTELGGEPSSVAIIPAGDVSKAITTASFDWNRDFDFDQDNVPGNDDIAIALTQIDIPTRVVDILKTNNVKVGETAIIAGYGVKDSKENPGTSSEESDGNLRAGLMKVSTASEEEINAIFSYSSNTTPGKNSMTCSGDSGGPFLIKRDSKWILAGVTSYGSIGCGPNAIAGFANITDPANQAFLAQYLP